MTEVIVIIAFVLWYVLSMVISENMGKRSKIGVEWSFFFSMILSPVIGFAITALTRNPSASSKAQSA